MRKIIIDLPKYRLLVNLQLRKRRGALVPNPIIPLPNQVHKKYKTGTVFVKYVRHFFDHKSIKKIFHSGMAVVVAGSILTPTKTLTASDVEFADIIIQPETTLKTEKSIQQPLGNIKINQSYSFFHPGVDFGSPIGSQVRSIRRGTVVFAGYTRDGYGNNILVDHGKGVQSLYAHLAKINVVKGESVELDTVLGTVGRSGRTTGPHLHLEVRVEGTSVNPFTVISK